MFGIPVLAGSCGEGNSPWRRTWPAGSVGAGARKEKSPRALKHPPAGHLGTSPSRKGEAGTGRTALNFYQCVGQLEGAILYLPQKPNANEKGVLLRIFPSPGIRKKKSLEIHIGRAF